MNCCIGLNPAGDNHGSHQLEETTARRPPPSSSDAANNNVDGDQHIVFDSKVDELAVTRGWYSNILSAEFISIFGHRVLRISLQNPIPQGYRIDAFASNNWLCLRNNEFGGMWRILTVSESNRVVHCEIVKKYYGHGGNDGAAVVAAAAAAAASSSNHMHSTTSSSGATSETAFAEPYAPTIPVSLISEDHYDWEVIQHEDRTIIVAKTDLHNEPLARLHPDECMAAKRGYVFFLQPLKGYCRANIHNIGSIDTINQSFVASFLCEVRLRGICKQVDSLYVQQFMKLLNIEHKLYVLRIKEEQSMERYTSYSLSNTSSSTSPSISTSGSTGYYDYTMKLQLKGTFHEEFELLSFPCDIQNLHLIMTCNRPNILCFEENKELPSLFMFEDFPLKSVFDVAYREVVYVNCDYSNPLESTSGYIYPRVKFHITLARKYEYYANNVAIPIGIISALSIISMSINEDGTRMETPDRLGITLTLLLIAVAYKFVVASSLPTLSYQTLLDKYVWCCFMFMIVIAVENAIIPIILHRYHKLDVQHNSDTSSVENAEPYLALALGLIYILMNVYWFVVVVLMSRSNRAEFELKYEQEKARRAAVLPYPNLTTTI